MEHYFADNFGTVGFNAGKVECNGFATHGDIVSGNFGKIHSGTHFHIGGGFDGLFPEDIFKFTAGGVIDGDDLIKDITLRDQKTFAFESGEDNLGANGFAERAWSEQAVAKE